MNPNILRAIALEAIKSGDQAPINSMIDGMIEMGIPEDLIDELRRRSTKTRAARVYKELNDCRYLPWEGCPYHLQALEFHAMLRRWEYMDVTRQEGEPAEVTRDLLDRLQIPHVVIEPRQPKSALILRCPCRIDEHSERANAVGMYNLRSVIAECLGRGTVVHVTLEVATDYGISRDRALAEARRPSRARRILLWGWNDLTEALSVYDPEDGEEEES
jgi:hypothetical protein